VDNGYGDTIMSQNGGLPDEQLRAKVEMLQQQVDQLTKEKQLLKAHQQMIKDVEIITQACLEEETAHSDSNKLIKNLIEIINTSSDEKVLNQSLQHVLDAMAQVTKAEKGSLFLLDYEGQVVSSILTQQVAEANQRQKLIDLVIDKGLAGWVYRHRQVGLVTDTEKDDRWINLPDQPYQVRSALVVPILRGKELLAIITLLHSIPDHFDITTAQLIQITANQIALTLENVALKLSFSQEQSASELQRQLLENLIDKGNTLKECDILHTTLQKVVDFSVDLTSAETSSLFLLDSHGKVSDTILSRSEVTPQQRSRLIGSVLDKGLAGWVSKHRTVGLIIDTDKDDRWLTLPNQPYEVRSALAIPILRSDQLLGILTLLHPQPNHFSNEVADLMRLTADHIALVLENARLYSKLDQYSKRLDEELQKGREIQFNFLPNVIYQPENWEIAAAFHPAKQLAGDFYDVFPLEAKGQVGLVLADVCDKGVGAALFMGLFRSLIRFFSRQSNLLGLSSAIIEQENPELNSWILRSPSTNMTHVNALRAIKLANDYVAKNHYDLCMFATMFFGILETSTGLLTYINAGHEDLFILNKGEIKHIIKSTSPAVGMMLESEFKIHQIYLKPGDILIGYTDGVTEGKNSEGEQFKLERLFPIFIESKQSASQLLDNIQEKLFDYIGDTPQFDDITMLAIHYHS
jgi:sigma-B regulation protein RsbU (phosphoserine phosphatase)